MATRLKQNLNDYVAEQIRGKILSRQYIPGVKLPNEFKLADEYEVCRYTVREAMKKLVATGLVTVIRGRGTFVNEVVPSSYFKPIIEKLILEDLDIIEIYDARIAIETKTARLAAINSSEDEIKEMKNTIENMKQALDSDDIQEFNGLDIILHNQIAIASKNRILDIVLGVLNDLIRFTIEKTSISKTKHLKSLKGHIKIVEAIEKRDAILACERMDQHLSNCKGLF